MSDLDILRQMIKDSVRLQPVDHHRKKMIELTEPQHPNSSVTISGLPDDTIVIKADAFGSPGTVFNGLHGECKRADFVIIADNGDKKMILCIEMKAGKGGSEKEIIQQLAGARCFVVYCREIGRLFWNTPDFLNGYKYRFASIKNISIAKQPTRLEKQRQINDRPESMLKISGKRSLQFNQLAAGNR
jgi:hypothetical protein